MTSDTSKQYPCEINQSLFKCHHQQRWPQIAMISEILAVGGDLGLGLNDTTKTESAAIAP